MLSLTDEEAGKPGGITLGSVDNEPVAWIPRGMTLLKPKDLTDCIPLYTHPAKTLTDEEIKEVYGEYFDIENCDWIHLQCIQAILKKASEK